jgi:hypothetical protein
MDVLPVDGVLTEPEVSNLANVELAGHAAEESFAGEFLLVSDERAAGQTQSGIETAGFTTVSDSCVNGRSSAICYGHGAGYGSGHYCPLHRRHGRHGYYGQNCEECPEDDCDCFFCRCKCCCKMPFCCLGDCLYSEGPGAWRREIHPYGFYNIAYPINPYHFDERDGRIYAAQGYGHPVAVPLAPNVEHTYNYGWGLPSSRLTPISRMPGAPGVAVPPGVAGPGILPQGPAPFGPGVAIPQ